MEGVRSDRSSGTWSAPAHLGGCGFEIQSKAHRVNGCAAQRRPLLARPPAKGPLRAAWQALTERTWQHPVGGRPIRFGVSTLERWYDGTPNQQLQGSSPCAPTKKSRANQTELLHTAVRRRDERLRRECRCAEGEGVGVTKRRRRPADSEIRNQ